MKNILIFSAICALLFTGCSNQENDGWKPGTIQFEITAGTQTRAIYSEEDIVPVIPSVDIHVYQDDLFVKTINIPAFTSGMVLTLEDANVLEAGEYQFLAVGLVEDDAKFTLPADWSLLSLTQAIATLSTANDASDIYAGNATETLTDQGGRVTIDMTRKVAGIMGYFANIPSVIDGKTVGYLRLTMSNTNTATNLMTGVGSVPTDAEFNVIEFDFTSQTAVEGVYPGIDLTGQGVVTMPNSYLDGKFIIPITTYFTLALYDADTTNTTPLKEWEINGGAAVDITANNLYKIGQKKEADNTNGGTPEDDTDDDSGFDMMSSQELTITVSPEWNDVIDLLE